MSQVSGTVSHASEQQAGPSTCLVWLAVRKLLLTTESCMRASRKGITVLNNTIVPRYVLEGTERSCRISLACQTCLEGKYLPSGVAEVYHVQGVMNPIPFDMSWFIQYGLMSGTASP